MSHLYGATSELYARFRTYDNSAAQLLRISYASCAKLGSRIVRGCSSSSAQKNFGPTPCSPLHPGLFISLRWQIQIHRPCISPQAIQGGFDQISNKTASIRGASTF